MDASKGESLRKDKERTKESLCVEISSNTIDDCGDEITLQLSPVERMALNDHKAGMEGLDKESINKIIHKASKGSKFYENERRKELNTKERIAKIHEELKGFTEEEKSNAFMKADKVLNELNEELDFTRTIVHIDMDAFYAAVETLDNPSLKDVPMAVGGMSMLCTSNYHARKFGVRAAMPGFIAKLLCPQLVLIETHFDKYRAVSNKVMNIFADYDPNFSAMSLDEAYLDLTEYIDENFHKYKREPGKDFPEIIVEEIRNKVFEKTQLTCSAGISHNLMLAKICSDKNKPNGQFYLKPEKDFVEKFIEDLPIRKVFGIGKVTEQILSSLHINTCKDLYIHRNILYLLFSETSFQYFMSVTLGLSANRITHSVRKSMSVERTFQNISNQKELENMCYELCKNLSEDLKKKKVKAFNISLKYKLSNFVTKTRARTISFAINNSDDIFLIIKDLLRHEIKSYPSDKTFELRLLGIRASQLTTEIGKSQNTMEKFFSEKITESETNNNSTDTDVVNCPVCNTKLSNDAENINTHIDQCLTKQTVKQIVKEQDNMLMSAVSSSTSASPSKQLSTTVKRKRTQTQNGAKNKKVTLHTFWKK